MNLTELVEHIKALRGLLRELSPEMADRVEAGLSSTGIETGLGIIVDIDETITDAQETLLEAEVESARQLVKSLDDELVVETKDREAFVNEQLRAIEEALKTAGPEERVRLETKQKLLKLTGAALLAAKAFQGVIIWDADERAEINKLMLQAEEALLNRRKLAAAISITVKVLKTSLSIAKKVALPT